MRFGTSSIIFIALLAILVQASFATHNNLETLKGHSLWKCPLPDSSQLKNLEKVSTLIKINELKEYVVVRVTSQAKNSSELSDCKVLVKDLSKSDEESTVESTNRMSTSSFFSDYQSYADINNQLVIWANKYSRIATYNASIGKSIEGRDIPMLKVSTGTKSSKKSIWFNGGIHAREWISPAVVMYTLNKILSTYKKNSMQNILNKFDIYFTPISNPDGYEYSRSASGDRLWRKNRRQNSDGTFGVDLNRNFDYQWGVSGASTDTNSDVYLGTAPLSEPETQALTNFGLNLPKLYALIDFHSYGQNILRPWGFAVDTKSSNDNILKNLGDQMKQAFANQGYEYTNELAGQLYAASGAMDDWWNSHGGQAFTVELCPTSDNVNFLLPASKLVPCAKAAWKANLAYMQFLVNNFNIPAINTP